jgi:transcriptional regulator with XRE-family HTH domain
MKPQGRAHNRAFGHTLRELRKRQGLSQDALGARAGLDRTFISLLELGQRSPTLDTMIAVINALESSPAAFLEAFCNNLPAGYSSSAAQGTGDAPN